jgi:predicted lipase
MRIKGKDAVDAFESGLYEEIEFTKVQFIVVFGHNLEISTFVFAFLQDAIHEN